MQVNLCGVGEFDRDRESLRRCRVVPVVADGEVVFPGLQQEWPRVGDVLFIAAVEPGDNTDTSGYVGGRYFHITVLRDVEGIPVDLALFCNLSFGRFVEFDLRRIVNRLAGLGKGRAAKSEEQKGE